MYEGITDRAVQGFFFCAALLCSQVEKSHFSTGNLCTAQACQIVESVILINLRGGGTHEKIYF